MSYLASCHSCLSLLSLFFEPKFTVGTMPAKRIHKPRFASKQPRSAAGTHALRHKPAVQDHSRNHERHEGNHDHDFRDHIGTYENHPEEPPPCREPGHGQYPLTLAFDSAYGLIPRRVEIRRHGSHAHFQSETKSRTCWSTGCSKSSHSPSIARKGTREGGEGGRGK